LYVGGLPQEADDNALRELFAACDGVKAARVVKKCGVRLVPRLYAHLNPMPYAKAKAMEVWLADSLRKRGFVVFGGH